MEIKGTAVKTTPEFIKKRFPNRYREWINSLPEASQQIMKDVIYATSWYPLHESVIIPTQKAGDMFFSSQRDAALELGKFSAEVALRGVYKIFVRISSPQFVLSRATSVFSTYYNPSDFKVVEQSTGKAVMAIKNFEKKDQLILYRIAGWMEKTLEITLRKDIKVNVKKSVDNNEKLETIITALWGEKAQEN